MSHTAPPHWTALSACRRVRSSPLDAFDKNNSDITELSIVTTMTNELHFANEISFKLKEGNNLDDLALDFCDYFEELNKGQGTPIEKASVIPGKLVVVKTLRSWFLGGTAASLTLFHSNDRGSGGAFTYIYSEMPRSPWQGRHSRAQDRLHDEVRTFFDQERDEFAEVEYYRKQEVEEAQSQEAATEPQHEEWLTPIRFCEKCGAAIAIDESSYCWNCGSRLPAQEKETAQYYGEETSNSRPTCDEIEYDRSCMVCKLGFDEGQLLAWCPHCGAAAHRVHMLEWLHVKENCPACGQRLATPELEEQFSQAHLR